ncbi:MAG: PTS galactitol transporter subunit IIC [Polyangiales bacterium]
MSVLDAIVRYVLGLGAPVMMPVLITLLGLAFKQGLGRSLRAGLTVGVGFIAIGLVVGLLIGVVGPKAMAFAEVLGLKLDVLDVGWPMGAAVSFATPIAAALIPTVLALNAVLVVAGFTRTVDVDLWNYWHFIYTGALVHAATGSFVLGMLAACITAVVVFKLADWTAPAVEHHFGLPGISLPHTETVNWAPLMYALDRLERRLLGARADTRDAAAIRGKLGVLGEPLVMGALLGVLIGALGAVPLAKAGRWGELVKEVLTLAVTMSAVLVVLPKVVAILMEGLIPISEGARDYLQKRFPGRAVLIGLDAAVVIGHPANMAIALLCVPIMLLLAVVLPGNRMLPFGDLAALPFYVLWGVAASRGNFGRGLFNAIVILILILWIGTSLAPLTTELARNAGFRPSGLEGTAASYGLWSGVALGSHLVPWIVLQLFRPGTRGFWLGLGAALGYAGIWWWVRGDIRQQFAREIAEAEAARDEAAATEPTETAETDG